MTRRRRTPRSEKRRLAAVGASALLVLLGAGYVCFTALGGLPWQSTYDIRVELPDASRLVANDTVRINGLRVGRVARVESRPGTTARPPYAVADIELETSAGPLPFDTRARTRAASVLGASYIALEPGTSRRKLPEGATLPLASATRSVDITDVFDVFDRRTSQSIDNLLGELGDGFAGRGPAFGDTLHNLNRLLPPTQRVMGTLAAPPARLPAFIRGYDAFAGAVGPVSGDLASLTRGGAVTFQALADERQALRATLERAPVAERALTVGLTRARPALLQLAGVFRDLAPASEVLPESLRAANDALRAAVPALTDVPAFANRIESTLSVLDREARRPSNDGFLRKLSAALDAAGPTVRLLEDAQVHCNAVGSMLDSFASFTTDNVLAGSSVAGVPPLAYALLQVTHLGAEGEVLQQSKPSRNVAINYLPHQNAGECESGNEPHDAVSQRLNNPPGLQGTLTPDSDPPADSVQRARHAGLLDTPEGWQP